MLNSGLLAKQCWPNNRLTVVRPTKKCWRSGCTCLLQVFQFERPKTNVWTLPPVSSMFTEPRWLDDELKQLKVCFDAKLSMQDTCSFWLVNFGTKVPHKYTSWVSWWNLLCLFWPILSYWFHGTQNRPLYCQDRTCCHWVLFNWCIRLLNIPAKCSTWKVVIKPAIWYRQSH